MRGVHSHQSVDQFERKCSADISHNGDVSLLLSHREVKDTLLQLQCSSAICWEEQTAPGSMAGRWCRKTHQNMWFCASTPVYFDNNYRGLLFWQVFPSLCQTNRTHGSVCSMAGSVPRGWLTRTRRDCWHCCHSERRRVSSAQALWGRSHTTSAVWMFHFSNMRHCISSET